jgi:hypothetical protein
VKKSKLSNQNDSFRITLTQVTFEAKKNKLQYVPPDQKKGYAGYLNKINGKEFWGTDGELPTRQYGQVSVEWGKSHFDLPSKAIENLFEPNWDYHYSAAWFDRESNTLYISADNSDGAGGYSVV